MRGIMICVEWTTSQALIGTLAIVLLTGCADGANAKPIPGPAVGLTPDPSSLALRGHGEAQSQMLTIYDGATGGTVSERDDCNAVVEIGAPQPSTAGVTTYAITPVGPGACSLTFRNAAGSSASVAITVTS